MYAVFGVLLLVAVVPVGLLIAGAVYLVRRVRFSVPGAQGADARELRSYVHTFSRTLSTLGVSRSARRRHVDELKANLAEAVAADGVRAALAGLGPAGALATGYADYRPRPAWLVGAVAAVLTWMVTMLVHLQYAASYADGWTDGMGSTGGAVSGNVVSITGWGLEFTGTMDGATIDVHANSPWLWVLPIAAFFIVSRSWRVLALRNAATVKA